jgi:uncharacterized protein (DUF433 family)
MSRYPLNLPTQLKQEAEELANRQGISLNQFIMWSVAEKVTALRQELNDPAFPLIMYRRGTSGWPVPVVRGTGIRVQTLVVAVNAWQMSPGQLAEEYDLSLEQVQQVLAFYAAHRAEIDSQIATETALEP